MICEFLPIPFFSFFFSLFHSIVNLVRLFLLMIIILLPPFYLISDGYDSEEGIITAPSSGHMSPAFDPIQSFYPPPELDKLCEKNGVLCEVEDKFDSLMFAVEPDLHQAHQIRDEALRSTHPPSSDDLLWLHDDQLLFDQHEPSLFHDVLPCDLVSLAAKLNSKDKYSNSHRGFMCASPTPSQSKRAGSPRGAVSRDTHNALERERRVNLRNRFDSLRAQVPTLKDSKAPSLHILREATRYITVLHEQESALLAAKEALLRQNEMLQKHRAQLSIDAAKSAPCEA
jgi:hypothetical protein